MAHEMLKLLVGGAVIGGGILVLASRASALPRGLERVEPRPTAKFRAGDTVTVTGGPMGSTATYVVKSASWTPSGWAYDLGTGTMTPQGALHMVEPVK